MKRTSILATIVTLVLVFGFTLFASAQQKATQTKSPDQKFVTEAASGSLFEIEAGKLAVQKASKPEVKEFGQTMIDDHSKASQELKTLAASKNIQLPEQMSQKHRQDLEKLSKYSGADFDKNYMEMMVKDHKKDVSEFRKQANDGKDPDLRAWASKKVAALEEHLTMAQDMTRATETKAGSGGGKN